MPALPLRRAAHRHGGRPLASRRRRGTGCLASRDGNTLRALIYYYREPDAQTDAAVTIDLTGLPPAAGKTKVERVVPNHGSAYETWIDLGRPDYVNRSILDALESASRPETTALDVSSPKLTVAPGTMTQLTVDLA